MQVTTENCTVLSVHILQKTISKSIKKSYPEIAEDEKFELTNKELEKFNVDGQTFEYVSMKNHLGGHRWFILCPKCKIKCHKLFLPPVGCLSKEHKYLCKTCHKLKNQSSLLSQNTLYNKVTKPLKRMKEIEDKIAVGHLRSDMVEKLLDEHESLEKSLKDTHEYRVYAFKKKHNMI